MRKSPVIPAFHADSLTRANGFLQQWMEWRLAVREAEQDAGYERVWYAGEVPNEEAIRAWTQELIANLPPTHRLACHELQTACRFFFNWAYIDVCAHDLLAAYTDLFVEQFPILRDADVTLRDAYFITWFVQRKLYVQRLVA